MEIEEHMCGLLGVMIGLLLIHLMITLYKIWRKQDGNCACLISETRFRGEMPNVESSRVEGSVSEERWNRTIDILENLTALQRNKSQVFVRDNPKVESFTGKGDVNKWAKVMRRAIGQIGGCEEDKVRFVLNHVEGAAAERLHNIKREWDSVEEIIRELLRAYRRKKLVWEIYENMAARKQGMTESVWEFLDIMLEMSEEAKQNGREMDKRIIGECMARNMKEPVLGLKLLGRIEQRPEDSLDEWIEWIAKKENDWKLMHPSKAEAECNVKKGGKETKNEVEQDKSAGGAGRYNNGTCYKCGSDGHFIARCPELRNRYNMQQNNGYSDGRNRYGYSEVRNRDSGQQDSGQGTQVPRSNSTVPGQTAEN